MARKTKLQLTFLGIIALVLSALAVVYTVSTGISQQASANTNTAGVASVVLPDGRSLILGGTSAPSTDVRIVDPRTGSSTALQSGMLYARRGHTATVLPDGRVLIVGGLGADGKPVGQVEVYDPARQRSELLRDANLTARSGHTATLLTDGRVVIVGGYDASGGVVTQPELWNYQTGRAETLSIDPRTGRAGHDAQLLADGRIYLAGGLDGAGRPAAGVLFDPAQQRFVDVDAVTPLNPGAVPGAATLAGSFPTLAARDVAIDSAIALRFSKPLDPASLNAQTITLIGPAGETRVRVVAAEGGMLVFLTPEGQLFPGSSYSVFVNGARDGAGVVLPFTTFSFNTVSLPGDARDAGKPGAGSGSPGSETDSSGKPETSPQPAPAPATGTVPGIPAGAMSPVTVAKTPTPPPKANEKKKPAPDAVDDEDWTPDARHRNGKWRRAMYASRQLKDSLKALRKAYTGGTAVMGQVLRLNGKPLAGVTLSVGGVAAQTDRNGRFILNGLSPGRHEMIIDGRRAGTGTVRPYGYYVAGVDLKPGELNELRYTIWMPKIRQKDITRIASPVTKDTVITHPDMPGLELHIPPGTVIRDREGKIVTEIAITPVPVDQAPFPVPENFPIYFMIHPGGAVIQGLDPKSSPGIRVVYPNHTDHAPGTEVRFWNFDPADRGWFIYGQGKVSADGTQVEPDAGVAIYDWMAFGYGVSNPDKDGPEPQPPPCEEGPGGNSPATDGDPVDCFTGLFVHARTDVVVQDVMPIVIHRVYRPGDTVVRPFGYGTSHNYAMYLQAPLINGVRSANIIDLILSNGARIRYRLTSTGTPQVWEHKESASRFYYSRLTQRADSPKSWEILLKDGSAYFFAPHDLTLIGMRDRFGNEVEITTSAGNITRLGTPNGRYVDIEYDTSSRIARIIDFDNRETLYDYDPANGMLSKVTYPDTTFEQYTYYPDRSLRTVRDRRGNTMVTNEYDTAGRVRKQILANGSSTYQFAYIADRTGRILQTDVTDPRGNVRRLRFDHPSGYVTSETRGLGSLTPQTTTTERDPASGRPVLVTDPLGRKTRYEYDPSGNVVSITYALGTSNEATEKFTWTPDFHQISTYTDPLNHTTTLSYDNRGRLTGIMDPLGQAYLVNFNEQGQFEWIYDPATARLLALGYDQGLVNEIFRFGRSTRLHRDRAGRVLTVTAPDGTRTHYTYDANDRVRTVADPHGGVTQLTFDPLGNLKQVTDPKNATTGFAYDARNRLWFKFHPAGPYEVFGYDGRSNLIRHTDRSGRTTTYNYDALDRLKNVLYPDTTVTELNFDPGNRLRSITDNPANPAATVGLDYDHLDRLTRQTTSLGTVAYTYDAASRRKTMTVSGQSIITYGYDNADRLKTLTQAGQVVAYDYDSADRRRKLKLPNGIDILYNFNAPNLLSIEYKQGTILLGNFTYGYDPAGRITTIGGSLNATNLPAPVTSAGHGPDHRLSTRNTDSYTYDLEGNLQTRTDACGTTTYTWNVKNQLTNIQGYRPNCQPLTASFTYDALGRRKTKTLNGQTTSFLYDGLTPVQEKQGSTTYNLLTGPGIDEYLARSDGTTTRYFLPDHLGSTVYLADPAGALKTRYTYSPFGETTQSGEASTNPFQYTGRENDNTGLYYYRARYYDPAIKRFISSDPIGLGGGLNTYAYVENNPLQLVDPLGLAGSSSGTPGLGPIVPPGGGTTRGPPRRDLHDAIQNWPERNPRDPQCAGILAGNAACLPEFVCIEYEWVPVSEPYVCPKYPRYERRCTRRGFQ